MGTKNIFMAAFAFCLAIGGAFASMFLPEPVYLHVRLNSATGAIVCVATDAQCDDSGQLAVCTVTVDVTKPGVGMQTASTIGVFKTFRVNCMSAIAGYNSVAAMPRLEFDDEIYELVPY